MKENIEEAVEILEHIKEYMQKNIDDGINKFIYNEQGFDEKCIDIINAINEILSDNKRVLKENEELLREKIDNKKIIALAQNEFLGYEQGYQDGKAGRKSATQAIIDNQQYYIIQEQIERYKNQIEKLQKENEELKETNKVISIELTKDKILQQDCLRTVCGVPIGEIPRIIEENEELKHKYDKALSDLVNAEKENKELKKFITEGITTEPNSPYKNYQLEFLRKNFIPVQKLKDKIEELKKWIYTGENAPQDFLQYRIKAKIQVLQDLLEEKGE